jgi:hypothetical protein
MQHSWVADQIIWCVAGTHEELLLVPWHGLDAHSSPWIYYHCSRLLMKEALVEEQL